MHNDPKAVESRLDVVSVLVHRASTALTSSTRARQGAMVSPPFFFGSRHLWVSGASSEFSWKLEASPRRRSSGTLFLVGLTSLGYVEGCVGVEV